MQPTAQAVGQRKRAPTSPGGRKKLIPRLTIDKCGEGHAEQDCCRKSGTFFLRPSGALHLFPRYPRLAPWAAFLRRLAADPSLDHLPRTTARNAVADVTTAHISRASPSHFGKFTHFSNCPLQFFGFIWYKQFTESRCVAAGRSLFESLVSARHLSFERMQSSQSSRPRDLIRKHQ